MGGWVDGRTVCHGTMETASPGTFVCLTDRPTAESHHDNGSLATPAWSPLGTGLTGWEGGSRRCEYVGMYHHSDEPALSRARGPPHFRRPRTCEGRRLFRQWCARGTK